MVTDKVLEIVVRTKDECYGLALAAKGNEIIALNKTVDDLREQLRYERAKSDGLVDRLLVRDAHVAAVSPAAIELAKHKDAVAIKQLKEAFEGLNDVGEIPTSKENRAFEMAGGSAVTR